MRVAFVGSYVPRRCGIATFTADTVAAVGEADPTVDRVVFAIEEPGARRSYGTDVVGRIEQGHPEGYREAALALNASAVDVVSVQHEFGLYGVHRDGRFEDHLVPFLETLRRPVLTTLHTILPSPEPWMREVLRAIAAASTEIVVMTRTAAEILRRVYGVTGPIRVIPHGMPPPDSLGPRRTKADLDFAGRSIVSTFGLVDPRKGLEHAIAAMAEVAGRHPDVLYLVIGQTHPELVRQQGEGYRRGLEALVDERGLRDHVSFIDRYVSQREILDFLGASDVYVTPYLDPHQITSGTLAYAMGAGKAIVSTPYLHAREALGHGRGILVPFRGAAAIASSVSTLLERPELRRRFENAAGAYAARTAWPLVGRRLVDALRAIASPGRTPRYSPRYAFRTDSIPRTSRAGPSISTLPRPSTYA